MTRLPSTNHIERYWTCAGNNGAWAAINPIGGPASRPFFSAVRKSGLVYIYSMYGEDVSPDQMQMTIHQVDTC